jgi:Protein of unknown function with HXXEE motif
MNPIKKAWHWLVTDWYWPHAALFSGILITILLLALMPKIGLVLFLVCIQLPMYLIHQFEEHYENRFRNLFNQLIGQGYEVLTADAAFIINSVFVWGTDIIAIYLAVFVNPFLGLIAAYLSITNAIVHLLQGIILRSYNPGLATGLLFFIPLGGWCVYELGSRPGCTWEYHALGLAIGILIHVGIMIHVRLRLAKLKAVS